MFGGFGTPPLDGDHHADHYEYVSDRSHQWYFGRGWNNQLVAYNSDSNEWEWPETRGQAPCPRAALAGCSKKPATYTCNFKFTRLWTNNFKLYIGFRSGSRVYIFGGRLRDTRMNDLYFLDLQTMTWSEKLVGFFFEIPVFSDCVFPCKLIMHCSLKA